MLNYDNNKITGAFKIYIIICNIIVYINERLQRSF